MSARPINTQEDFNEFVGERNLVQRWRDAITRCKDDLSITALTDRNLGYEERMNFERCITENYLLKHGLDYFGKRDFLYVDLFDNENVKNYSE